LHNEPKDESLSNIKSGDIFASIISEVELIVTNNGNLLSFGSTFEELMNCIETLSIAIILIGIIHSLMKSKMNIFNKKNRRKKDISGTNDIRNDSLVKTYISLVTKFDESAQRIEKIIKSIDISALISSKCFSLLELSVSFE
jgi:hypothetical protein